MFNKILGIILFIAALGGIIVSFTLFSTAMELAWTLLAGSLLLVLVAVVVFRKGLKAVIGSVHDSELNRPR